MADEKQRMTIVYKSGGTLPIVDAKTTDRIKNNSGFVYVFPSDTPREHMWQLQEWIYAKIAVYEKKICEAVRFKSSVDPEYVSCLAAFVEEKMAKYAKEFGLQKMFAKDFVGK